MYFKNLFFQDGNIFIQEIPTETIYEKARKKESGGPEVEETHRLA